MALIKIQFQKNLQDTVMGRDLLESIDLLCAGENYYPQPVCFKDIVFLYFVMHEYCSPNL